MPSIWLESRQKKSFQERNKNEIRKKRKKKKIEQKRSIRANPSVTSDAN